MNGRTPELLKKPLDIIGQKTMETAGKRSYSSALKNQMDQDELKSRLDNCLVENYLKSPEVFEKLEDPFPKWFESTS